MNDSWLDKYPKAAAMLQGNDDVLEYAADGEQESLNNAYLRRSGRTTLKLKEALDHAMRGNNVYYVMAYRGMFEDAFRSMRQICINNAQYQPVIFSPPTLYKTDRGSLRIITLEEAAPYKIFGAPHGFLLFFDHSCDETPTFCAY